MACALQKTYAMEENPKETMEARDAFKRALFTLLTLDPLGGWAWALQAIYDSRWDKGRKAS